MLQTRKITDQGEERWYSPDRDLAYAFPSLARAALDQLAITNWKPWFADYFAFAGLTEADIGEAAVAFAKYFEYVCSPEISSPRQAFERAGWFELKSSAQVALFMKLGQVCTMAFYTAIRDITPFNTAPPIDQAALYASAMRANSQLVRGWSCTRWARRQWASLKGYAWPFRRGDAGK